MAGNDSPVALVVGGVVVGSKKVRGAQFMATSQNTLKTMQFFLKSSRALSATQEQADILDIEPKQLYEELKLAKFVIESGFRKVEGFSDRLPENWVDKLYVAIDNFYEEELENAEKPQLTDEVNSLAVFFNQKTDEFLIRMRDLGREYDSLAGHFRRSTSTYNYDSGEWMGAFLDGLSKFLDIAQKQEFNIEKLSSEHDTTLGSERYRIKIEGINPEGQPHATFAQAFDGDVKHFSNTGTYGHAVCNGKVALYVTLYNLGNDESLLYKNGQSQYWYLGSLITI